MTAIAVNEGEWETVLHIYWIQISFCLGQSKESCLWASLPAFSLWYFARKTLTCGQKRAVKNSTVVLKNASG